MSCLRHRKTFACTTALLLALTMDSERIRAAVPAFREVTVDDRIEIGYGLAIADVDGDGAPDIVLADKHLVAWYRNPDWQKSVIAERLTELDHVCVAARDLDGDGKAEIAVGAGWNPGDTIGSGALFYLSPPADRRRSWEPIRLAHDPTIHRIRWVRTAGSGFDLVSVPLHGRGNRNGMGDGVRILAYHPPRDPKAPWTTSLVADEWHLTHNFDPVGAATGPGEDLLVGAREGIFLLERSGTTWNRRVVATNGPAMAEFIGAGEVRAGRVKDEVAFVTAIEPMHGNQLAVYLPPAGEAGPGPWRRQVIDETLVDGHALACGDLLGQGRDQIVAGWRAMNRPGVRVGIRLYQSTGDAGRQWVSHPVDDNRMACEDLQLADLDRDGDLDIVAAGRATKNVKVYFNETPGATTGRRP